MRVKELFVFVADQEIQIEKLRQILCSMKDFEPYTAFRRIDRANCGFVDRKSVCQFLRENGFRELEPEDFGSLIKYFDLTNSKKLNYHDFL